MKTVDEMVQIMMEWKLYDDDSDDDAADDKFWALIVKHFPNEDSGEIHKAVKIVAARKAEEVRQMEKALESTRAQELADIMEKWELSEDRDESEILDLIAEHFPDEDIEDLVQAVKMTALRKQLLGPLEPPTDDE